jgi:hypothetical protein
MVVQRRNDDKGAAEACPLSPSNTFADDAIFYDFNLHINTCMYIVNPL